MKIKHVVEGSTYSRSTERSEVYAYCGYAEEASGSGKHTVDKGEVDCEVCHRLAKVAYAREDNEY